MGEQAGTDANARFEQLYRDYAGRVLAYALRRTDAELAYEVVAETFVVVWRRLERVPTEPLPWLLGVARRVLANERRSSERRRSLLVELAANEQLRPRVQIETEPVAKVRAVANAITALPENDQELLKLVIWDGLSTKDAAVVMGYTSGACRVRIHRAKRRLAAQLERDEGVESGSAQSPVPKIRKEAT